MGTCNLVPGLLPTLGRGCRARGSPLEEDLEVAEPVLGTLI